MVKLKLETALNLSEIIEYSIDNPLALDDYCIYIKIKKNNSEEIENFICYVSDYSEVDDNDNETYPDFVRNNGLELFISGENFEDIRTNTLHQKTNATVNDFVFNLNYYLQYDTFFDF